MIDRSEHDDVTLLRMRRHPANVLDREFCDGIERAVRSEIERGATRAIVLTGSDGVFSAGVDLFRLLEEGEEYLETFLASLDRLLDTVATSPTPLVAAISGHAIAGGGIIALACDVRIMIEGPSKFGLPELKVGVPFPGRALDIVRAAVPPHVLAELVLLGRTFDAAGARERGLVHELVAPADLEDRALRVATELAGIPPRAFELTKRLLALPPGADTSPLDERVRAVWGMDSTREHIRGYLERTLGTSSR